MKIQKGHYVPKELITSEAVHEAVVKCFVAAEFVDCRPMYGKFENKDCFSGLCADKKGCISWGAKGSLARTQLTLQQLFTAENGLQWPDWAEKVVSNGQSVWFDGGKRCDMIYGCVHGGPESRILATRQTNDEVSEISKSKPDAEAVSEKPESNWFERGLTPAIGSKVTIAKGTDDLSDFGKQFIGQECIVRSIFKNQYSRNIVSVERPDGACGCFVLGVVEPAKTEREKPDDQLINFFDLNMPLAGMLTVRSETSAGSCEIIDFLYVGSDVLVSVEVKSKSGKVCGVFGDYVWVKYDDDNMPDTVHKLYVKPIKSERQKLIDVIVSVGNQSEGILADAILNAGFQAPKGDKNAN